MNTVAIAAQKGGVGKTTLALGLASELTLRGQRVLLVDLDPQGYATVGAGLEPWYGAPTTEHLGTALLGQLEWQSPGTEADVSHLGAERLLAASPLGFSVLPAHLDMTVQEATMVGMRGRETRLRLLLAEYQQTFDWCIIDCPPHLGVLTDNALLAADQVVVPVIGDAMGARGLALLLEQVSGIEKTLGVTVNVLGVVVNLHDDTKVTTGFDTEMARLRVPVLARMRRRVKVKEAYEQGLSIHEADPDGQTVAALAEIANAMGVPAAL